MSITSAAPPLTEDLGRRARRYLIQMSVRVVCFLGAVLIDHWTRWLLLAGAVVLPYVAVLGANAVGVRRDRPIVDPDPAVPGGPPALPPGAVGRRGGMGAD